MRLKQFIFISLAILLAWQNVVCAQPYPHGAHRIVITPGKGIRAELLRNIAPIIEKSIAEGNYPGAVVLVGHRGHIIYKGVFGNRRVVPSVAPMQFDTIFDVASLTKVVATAPAIMQLVEQGKIRLDAPVAKYWPEFASNDKEKITIRELLTHTSGLSAAEVTSLSEIERLAPKEKPGTTFIYSDVNFVVLSHLVEIISHEKFDHYANKNIFQPLGMKDTFFLPSDKLQNRIAPTEIIDNELRWGKVHDPVAYAMKGVAGNAGVFSTAHDLAIFAQCLLNGGKMKASHYLLGPLTVLKMTSPQTANNIDAQRGFGWDIDSPYSNRGELFPVQSYGHTGWTGTSLWIDPRSKTFVIVLTSRTHPVPAKNNQIVQDRRAIANIVAASITDIRSQQKNTHLGELKRAYDHSKA